MRAYILSVICAAVLCGIVSDLSETKGASSRILKLICGIFLSFTVIRPVTTVKLEEFSFFASDIARDAFQASDMGKSRTYAEMAAIISAELSAYILDKAEDYPGLLEVNVALDENLVPCGVTLTGEISRMGKQKLEQILEKDLGIGKEDQIWNE